MPYPSKRMRRLQNQRPRLSWAGAMLACILMAVSCSPFAPAKRPDAPADLPDTYALYEGAPDPMQPWWQSLASEDLSALIGDAFAGNFSLQEAWARLRQANARAVQAGADLYPTLDATAGALGGQAKTSGVDNARRVEDVSVGLVSRYELDLWGRIRSEREAARLEAKASREDISAAAITLSAEVADRWVRIVAQRQQLALLRNQLKNNQTILELIELRFRKAMVSALDVYQQKQVVENVQADIPLAEAQEKLLMHELAILTGKPPRSAIRITQERVAMPAGIPETGIPADLLANRPDIQSAGQRLYAADYQVAAARANRLPSISFTANARYGEGDLSALFDNWLLTLSGNLVAPIFDGNLRKAEVERRRAIADENLWAYRRTVYTAVKEVEDAIINETKQREHIAGLEQVLATSQRALEEAGQRYRNGLIDYLPVLTQLLAVQDQERDLIRQKAILVQNRVSLYRALGGTWTRGLTTDGLSQTAPQLEQKTNEREPS